MMIRPATLPVGLSNRHDHTLCGWRVASAVPLPDLLPWTGDDRAPDLTIDLGPVPERLKELTVDRPLLQVAGDGTCRFGMPGVAAYLIAADGRRVIIDPTVDPSAPDVRLFLFGTVFAVLCYRRGLLPLHASCVRIGDSAVALAGLSGIGKSTLAAAFMQRGHTVLADDVTVLDTATPGIPRVLPSFPRLKLWRDAVDRMDLPVGGLERTRPVMEKYNLPVVESFCTEPLPLASVVHLDFGPTLGMPTRLRGAMAVERMRRDLYRKNLVDRFGIARSLMPALLRAALVPRGTWTVSYVGEVESLDPAIAAIESLVKA